MLSVCQANQAFAATNLTSAGATAIVNGTRTAVWITIGTAVFGSRGPTRASGGAGDKDWAVGVTKSAERMETVARTTKYVLIISRARARASVCAAPGPKEARAGAMPPASKTATAAPITFLAADWKAVAKDIAERNLETAGATPRVF